MALIYQFKNKWNDDHLDDISYTSLILDSFDAIYPPDGVDSLDETLNGSKEEFNSEEGKKFRTNFLTRLSSFVGLPNRKLRKNSGQSAQNLDDNFIGKQPDASTTRNSIRALITPLNVIMMPLKLALNLLKLITEFIPGLLSKTVFMHGYKFRKKGFYENSFFKALGYSFLGGLLMQLSYYPLLTAYFLGCCLTSPYDTMKSAWRLGNEFFFLNGKPLAYLFVGVTILSTVLMFTWATPLALKTFAITVVPIISHYLPSALINFVAKIGSAISPTLTAIGHALSNYVIAFPAIYYVLYTLPFHNIISTAPAFIGASLFIATAIATIGPSISGYINDYKAWWNFNPDFVKPLENEGANIDVLSQQCKMLCALREPEETKPVLVVSEDFQVPADPASEYKPRVDNAVNNSAVSANLNEAQINQDESHSPNENKLSAPSENKATDPDRIIHSSTSPRKRS